MYTIENPQNKTTNSGFVLFDPTIVDFSWFFTILSILSFSNEHMTENLVQNPHGKKYPYPPPPLLLWRSNRTKWYKLPHHCSGWIHPSPSPGARDGTGERPGRCDRFALKIFEMFWNRRWTIYCWRLWLIRLDIHLISFWYPFDPRPALQIPCRNVFPESDPMWFHNALLWNPVQNQRDPSFHCYWSNSKVQSLLVFFCYV